MIEQWELDNRNRYIQEHAELDKLPFKDYDFDGQFYRIYFAKCHQTVVSNSAPHPAYPNCKDIIIYKNELQLIPLDLVCLWMDVQFHFEDGKIQAYDLSAPFSVMHPIDMSTATELVANFILRVNYDPKWQPTPQNYKVM